MNRKRALYISPISMNQKNGMMQRQHQTLDALSNAFGGSVDVLSLAAPPQAVIQWLKDRSISATVLRGLYAFLARYITSLWYVMGVILCNKLRLTDHFRFFVTIPVPKAWFDRYEVILCYYPWAYHLLRLERGAKNVIVDLGDVMANRHQRTGARRWITISPEAEQAILRSNSRCIAISRDDADEFKQLYGVDVPVAPYIPPCSDKLIAMASNSLPRGVGYMAAPGFVNEEVLRLISDREFLGHLASSGVELVVAGGICDLINEETLQTLREHGAVVLGRIDDVSSYYEKICVTVNPVGPSSGAKIKSIEALIAGRLLITTRWGADETLKELFGSRITCLEWPIKPSKLAEATLKIVERAALRDGIEIERYIHECSGQMQTLLCS